MQWRLQNKERKREGIVESAVPFLDSHGKIIRDVLQIIKLKVHFREMVWIKLCENQFNLQYHQVVIL